MTPFCSMSRRSSQALKRNATPKREYIIFLIINYFLKSFSKITFSIKMQSLHRMYTSSWLGMYQYHIPHHHYWKSLQSQDPYQDSLRK